jgi:hypothetical protein
VTEDEAIRFLWKLLDDIDTLDDICKFDDKSYRKIVRELVSKRWMTGIETDGYSLDLSPLRAVGK